VNRLKEAESQVVEFQLEKAVQLKTAVKKAGLLEDRPFQK